MSNVFRMGQKLYWLNGDDILVEGSVCDFIDGNAICRALVTAGPDEGVTQMVHITEQTLEQNIVSLTPLRAVDRKLHLLDNEEARLAKELEELAERRRALRYLAFLYLQEEESAANP